MVPFGRNRRPCSTGVKYLHKTNVLGRFPEGPGSPKCQNAAEWAAKTGFPLNFVKVDNKSMIFHFCAHSEVEAGSRNLPRTFVL